MGYSPTQNNHQCDCFLTYNLCVGYYCVRASRKVIARLLGIFLSLQQKINGLCLPFVFT